MIDSIEREAAEKGFRLTGHDLFGRYAKIAYGHALNGKQDYHIYKCIQRFRSNCYCDVPLTYQTENNCYKHEEMTDVVNVIHCGIDESRVIRVALRDVELLPTISPDEVRGVGISNPFEGVWLPVPDKIGDCLYKCSQCGFVRDAYILDVGNYCPNCGAKMEVTDDA